MHHPARRKTLPTTELLRHAERNKVLVLLEFAEKINAKEIVKAEKRKLKRVAEVVAEVHEALKDVDHVFVIEEVVRENSERNTEYLKAIMSV